MVSLLSVTASQGGSVLVLYYSRTGPVLWRFYLAFRGVNYDFVVSIPRNAGLSQCSTRRSRVRLQVGYRFQSHADQPQGATLVAFPVIDYFLSDNTS